MSANSRGSNFPGFPGFGSNNNGETSPIRNDYSSINNHHENHKETNDLSVTPGKSVNKNEKSLRQYQSFMSTDSVDPINPYDIVRGIHGRLIRTGSVILAETGERTRGLRIFDNNTNNRNDSIENETDDFNEDLERQPLIDQIPRRSILSNRIHAFWIKRKLWLESYKYQYVLKCSLAYFIASLAVYNTHFSNILGKSDSKHVVATVAVYFHPSRSFGSMHQSLIFVTLAIVFSFTVSLISTSIASTLYSKGFVQISALVNLTFVSVALGLVSYMKQKMNHPTFNVSCSLAAISLISSIVKEGALDTDSIPIDRLYNLFKIVTMGSLISVTICYLVIPTSATNQLKKELNNTCSLMSQYLLQIEKAFINGNNVNADQLISGLNAKLKKNSTNLTKLLGETKFELYLVGHEKEYAILKKLVRCAQLMCSELGGLKGSAELQWSALHNDISGNDDSGNSLRSIDTLDSDHQFSQRSGDFLQTSQSTLSLDEMTALNSSQLFDLFIYYLGPSLKSFCYTIRGVLDGMPFEEHNNYPTRETHHYRNSLILANDLFKKKYERAMSKLYDQSVFKDTVSLEAKIDEEEVAASCGNFASVLSEYSKELNYFIQHLTEYSEIILDNPRSWHWFKFWEKEKGTNSDVLFPDLNYAIKSFNITLQKRTDETDERDSFTYKIWEFFSHFRKVEVQFGIRVGLGAFVLASLAYLPSTKQKFMEWRGEWALVTYSIIMNKSLGGTTMTVNWRLLGTFLGAFIAYAIWSLSDANVFALCLTGWIISIYSFNIILNWSDNNAYGRFILLTYNITALYSYNTTRSEDLEEGDTDPIIFDIALHRFISITAAVVWALIMTVSFLPITARRRLKRGISILWLRLGVIWNTDPLQYKGNRLVGLADQSGINHIMRELELLLKQAPKETRLKGRFRVDIYKKLMSSTEKIIDAFQNFNTMISVEPTISQNELIVLRYTEQERDELQNRIFLIFYMISSSITLGIPLPSKPASTEHARDRIMVKLREIRLERPLSVEDYVLLYSYALISNVITNELNKIIKLLGDLYGLVDEETFQI